MAGVKFSFYNFSALIELSEPVRMPAPVNSEYSDFAPIIMADGTTSADFSGSETGFATSGTIQIVVGEFAPPGFCLAPHLFPLAFQDIFVHSLILQII